MQYAHHSGDRRDEQTASLTCFPACASVIFQLAFPCLKTKCFDICWVQRFSYHQAGQCGAIHHRINFESTATLRSAVPRPAVPRPGQQTKSGMSYATND